MSAAADPPHQAGSILWRSVLKLARLRWLIFTSGLRRGKLRQKIGTLILGVLVIAGMIFAFVISWYLLKFLRSPEIAQYVGDLPSLLAKVPVMVVSAAFIGILITSFGVLLSALYLAGDMDFLLSAPVPIRAVFITKMGQAVLPNFGLILFFGLPVLYGLGLSGAYNFLFYPLALITLAMIALAAAGLASLLVMSVVRIVPARRVAEVLGFVTAVIMFIFSQSGQFINRMNISSGQITQAVGLAARFDSPWSPLAWAGRSLVDIGEGRWLSGILLFLLTLLLTGGIFAVSLWTAERLYYSGWASVKVSPRRKPAARPTRQNQAPAGRMLRRIVPADVYSIVYKDFLTLRRDLRNMSQLVTPLLLGIMYAFFLVSSGGEPPPGRGEAPPQVMEALRGLMVYGNVAISLFVGWSLIGRLGGMGFSQEGKSYWLLKTAPISAARLLASKFLVAYLPGLALVWVFLLAISLLQQTALGILAYGMAAVALIAAGVAGMNLAFGVIGANFNWEDPRRIAQGSAGCLGSLASMVFLVLSMALFFGPGVILSIFGIAPVIGQGLGLLLGGAASLACAIIPLWLVRRKVAHLNE